jgi:uncharacterized protein YbjT (DUF2867 family)
MTRQASAKILVAGATGYIGGGVIRALRSARVPFRALTRDPRRFAAAASHEEVFVGEATQRASLRGACEGVDAVFSSIGIRSFARKPTLWEVDYQANINLLEEAVAAGVKHFIFVSVLNGPLMGRMSPIAEAREMVARAVLDSPLGCTIYRPTSFFNDMAELVEATRTRGALWLFGDGGGRVNPLSSIDLGEDVVRVLASPLTRRAIRPVGGPEVWTHRALAELAFQVVGRTPTIHSVPPAVLHGAAAALRPFHENAYGLLRFFEFVARTPDMCGAPLGRRRIKPFFERLAAGASISAAEMLDGNGAGSRPRGDDPSMRPLSADLARRP